MTLLNGLMEYLNLEGIFSCHLCLCILFVNIGPCLSIRPYLGESDVKLSHPSSIHNVFVSGVVKMTKIMKIPKIMATISLRYPESIPIQELNQSTAEQC